MHEQYNLLKNRKKVIHLDVQDHSLFGILEPDALIYGSIWEEQLSSTVPLSLVELAFEDVAILQVLLSFSLLQVVHKLAFVSFAVVSHHLAVSACSIVDELSFVDITICEDQLTITSHFVLEESSFVDVLVGPNVFASALHHSLVHFSLIDVSIFEVILALAVLFAITGLTLVNTIIVLNGFLQVLQSICHFFFSEYFSRQVLQLPYDDLISSISDCISRNAGILAICQDNVKFLNGQGSVFIFLEILQGFYSLVNIFPP